MRQHIIAQKVYMRRRPAEWPKPQRRPIQKPLKRAPHDSCTSAVMWSGPVITCTMPSVPPSQKSPGISLRFIWLCTAVVHPDVHVDTLVGVVTLVSYMHTTLGGVFCDVSLVASAGAGVAVVSEDGDVAGSGTVVAMTLAGVAGAGVARLGMVVATPSVIVCVSLAGSAGAGAPGRDCAGPGMSLASGGLLAMHVGASHVELCFQAFQ
jgi:hypothetical protein